MDNHYVPNLTIGPMVCKALKDYGIKAPIDVHLMVSPVDEMINDFADAGADFITFHPEATRHVDRSLSLIRSRGCKAGLVFNPSTNLDILDYVMDKVDIILLMSVNPGFGGQKFIPQTLEKAKKAKALIDASGYDISLEIDGGETTTRARPRRLRPRRPPPRPPARRAHPPLPAPRRRRRRRQHQGGGRGGRRHVRRGLGDLQH